MSAVGPLCNIRWSIWSQGPLTGIIAAIRSLVEYRRTTRKSIMSTTYKKAGLICAAAVTAAVLSAVPISVERSAKSDIVVSVSQAQAYYGHYRRVTRRVYRRAVRRCAYGVTCY
jgi:hypothetical protein